jgi:hypothetical protein
MSKVIAISGTDGLTLPQQNKNGKQNSQGLSTSDYRRLLSQLSLRPPTQRAFMRKLLTRAIARHKQSPRNKPRCSPRRSRLTIPTTGGGVLSLAPPSEP